MLPVVGDDGSLAYPLYFKLKKDDETKRILFWGIELDEALLRGALIVTSGFY